MGRETRAKKQNPANKKSAKLARWGVERWGGSGRSVGWIGGGGGVYIQYNNLPSILIDINNLMNYRINCW